MPAARPVPRGGPAPRVTKNRDVGSSTVTKNMIWVPGGAFLMGSADFYPEEGPVRRVEVDGFWMDDHPVTVAEFRRFVKATGYVTVAERPLDPQSVSRRGSRPAKPGLAGLLPFQRAGRPA